MQEDSAISKDVWMSSALTYATGPRLGSPIVDSNQHTSALWWTSSSRTALPRQWPGHFWPVDVVRSFCLLFWQRFTPNFASKECFGEKGIASHDAICRQVPDFRDLVDDHNNPQVLKGSLNFEDNFFSTIMFFDTKNVSFHLQRRNTTFCRHKNDVRKVIEKSVFTSKTEKTTRHRFAWGGITSPLLFTWRKNDFFAQNLWQDEKFGFTFHLGFKNKNKNKRQDLLLSNVVDGGHLEGAHGVLLEEVVVGKGEGNNKKSAMIGKESQGKIS